MTRTREFLLAALLCTAACGDDDRPEPAADSGVVDASPADGEAADVGPCLPRGAPCGSDTYPCCSGSCGPVSMEDPTAGYCQSIAP